MRLFNVLFLLLLVLLSSCESPKYLRSNRKIVSEVYGVEKLKVKHYLFSNYMENSWGVILDQRFEMNNDSLFNIFKLSLLKLKLECDVLTEPINHWSGKHGKGWQESFAPDIEKFLISLSSENESFFIVPIIAFRNSSRSGMNFTSSGAAGGSRYLKRNDLFLTVAIVGNGKIQYRRTAVFLSDFYPAYEIEEIQHLLTQQDWDELVALVMKDYVERIRE
jgi:hypothetical protein